MTRWIDDPTLEAPDGHRWVKPAPDDCPNCGCCTARLCEAGRESALGCIGRTNETDPVTRHRIAHCPCSS